MTMPIRFKLPRHAHLFSVLLLASACNEKEGATEATDTDAADTTGTGDDTGTPIAACECEAGDPCSAQLCDVVERGDAIVGEGMTNPAFEAALTCTLEAMRDHEVGRVRWTHVLGESDEYGSYELLGDGTARRTSGGRADLCQWNSEEVIVGTLREPQYFADCLPETDVDKRFNCFKSAIATETSVCVEGDYQCSE